MRSVCYCFISIKRFSYRFHARRALCTTTTMRCVPSTRSSLDTLAVEWNRRFSSLKKEDMKEYSAAACVTENGKQVLVLFAENGDQSTFHAPWLWSNDPTWVHPTSGQRLQTPGGYSSDTIIKSVDIVSSASEVNPNGVVVPFPPPPKGSSHPVGNLYDSSSGQFPANAQCLRVTWKSTSKDSVTHVSYYDLGWLKQWRYDEDALNSRRETCRVTTLQALQKDGWIPTFDYEEMEKNAEDFMFRILDAVFESGAALVQNAPSDTSESCTTVAEVGRLLGGSLSHGALYGDTFDVISKPNANNIAYTSVPLGPHQDLAYYESKPGLQLLHCLSNEGVEGGESVLVDSMAAAEELRRVAPEHFDTLAKCSATFVKQRNGADMIYRRPHIVLDDSQEIVSVNWSPPFEGPLAVSPHLVEAYYRAYGVFERMLDNSLPENYGNDLDSELASTLREYAHKCTWQRRLDKGEILIFNNVRMLHGRRGFEFNGESGGRHLCGCYTNIDDTLNRYRVQQRKRSDSGASVRSAGNGTSGMP